MRNPLAPNVHEYPNSASFVAAIWRARYAMFLCESDQATVLRLRSWANVAREFPGCDGIEVAEGDWRTYITGPLLPSSDLTVFSFDPYMFDRHGSGRNPGNMDPSDLDRISAEVDRVQGSVIVQLTTYSANNDNAQPQVRGSVTSRLAQSGLKEVAVVRADGNMMSMIFERQVVGATSLGDLADRFQAWLGSVRRRRSA